MNGTGNDQYISAEAVPTGYTYFIRVDDAIKIGSAVDFKRRLHALQTSHEKLLNVLAVVPSAVADEYRTHQRFHAYPVDTYSFQC